MRPLRVLPPQRGQDVGREDDRGRGGPRQDVQVGLICLAGAR